MDEKNLSLERLVYFSDAVVAIAITLLALDLKLDVSPSQHITFQDLLQPWQNYLAFFLSFFSIANLWQQHHYIYKQIHKLDARLMSLNVCWLFFVVIFPFCTTLVSTHFGDKAAVFTYSLNILLLSLFQNLMWNYAYSRPGFMDRNEMSQQEQKRFRVLLFLDIPNGLIAVVLSFFNPLLAFILLFFRVPVFIIASIYVYREKKLVSTWKKGPRQPEQ